MISCEIRQPLFEIVRQLIDGDQGRRDTLPLLFEQQEGAIGIMDNRNTPHELDEMFPQAKAAIHDLKTTNAHFARIADEYHQVNRIIHRMETKLEPTTDEVMEVERKKRLRLLDEIAAMLDGRDK